MSARLVAAAIILIVTGTGWGCGSDGLAVGPSQSSASTTTATARVLVITTTAGFRHDSIPTAIATLRSLAASSSDLSVTFTEDLSALTTESLSRYDVVMFALTSGELPLSAAAKAALLDFVSSGHGFVGVHSATDTLYEWPDYGRLIGAYFSEHPWTQRATIVVEDRTHPTTAGLDERFTMLEEFYTFRDNPRGRVQILLRLDAASVGSTGDYPLAWTHSFGVGRVYYNALGHFAETWNDPGFRRQMAGAIRWAAGR